MKEEKCEICGKKADMIVDNHIYCALHYVENEGEECLRNDLMFVSGGAKLGISEESTKRILAEIKKKYPKLAEEWKELF